MRIAFITAGAAGMYCGSCMRDNALVTALRKLGHDALLIPTYTPITVDEADASQQTVFFGGVNVYLEQKFWLFRHTPRFLDRLLNFRWLLKFVSRFAVRTKYSELGALTISMLQGTHGHQAKEVAKLVEFLRAEKPDLVLFTNALLSGVIPEVKRQLGVPVLVTLQGDDIFLDELPERDRRRCFELIRANGRSVDGYISTSHYYADHMAGYIGLPRERIHVIHPGINLAGHGGAPDPRGDRPLTIGYFARICPEKGFHRAVEAFIALRGRPGAPAAKLKASGWLGANNRPYFDAQLKRLEAAGLRGDFEHVESPGHDDKVRFMRSIDVLCVPTVYREPKGLYVLEAWANGVPAVLPAHGTFPELIEATGGGRLADPGSVGSLADELARILTDHEFRARCGAAGLAALRERFTAEAMAANTMTLLESFVRTPAPLTA
ncbi:glycosyltransferase family 4 protein [Gemmata sp. JC717]|uniref:Glycosyltransferase family 4 protein n=1 Tax=Gemmata algarum TaxID=2975278 RepID=A0ABU5F8K0_9BACT|nr:glycosyltransferase family 4 protein [Gemmata algarum]MDY3555182.1 glycosyltransferase family 4 protein [Gemmata algarum]MDY3563656.1 glycosyltransferase family 4 protein [Gemmata algarum]